MKKGIFSLLLLLFSFTMNAQTNVVFYTSMGNFMVEIREDLVPIPGDNFLDLVNDEFYDGLIFHRVIDGFVIQGGDPTGTGSGGPGYMIDDQFHPDLSNEQMAIAMASSGPNTAGSQFYFNLVDNYYLDYDEEPLEYAYSVFGIVTEGFEVVQDIGTVETNGSDRPLDDVVIDSIRVTDEYVFAGLETEVLAENTVKVYPNPVTSASVIQVNAVEAGTSSVTLYDACGKLISTKEFSLVQGKNEFDLFPLTAAINTAGIYHLQVTIEGVATHVRLSITE